MNAATSKPSALPDAPAAAAVIEAPCDAPKRKSTSPGNMGGLLLIVLIVVVTGALAFPTFIILACGMVPALVAALIDDKPGRHVSYCVIAASLAGIAPVLSALWAGGNTVAVAMLLLGDVYVWLGMYSAAALGWSMIWLFTIIAELVLSIIASMRVRKLYLTQEEMVAEWGEGVTGKADFD